MLTDLHGAEIHSSLKRALRRYVRAALLAIDDFSVLATDHAQAKFAFQVIAERYDYRRSNLIMTNRRFKEWTKVFPRMSWGPLGAHLNRNLRILKVLKRSARTPAASP